MPHIEVLGDVDSLSETSTVNETEQDLTEENRGPQHQSQFKDINKKRKQSIDIGEYLFNKQIEDREKRLKQEKQKDEIWKEKKILKEREIEAIEKLAEAISKQNTKKD